MFARTSRMIVLTGALASALTLVACGESGSSGTTAPATGATGAGCAPVAGEQLALLADDKKLQNSDNIVAAVNARAANPALLAAVNKVAAVLDQPKLLDLNRAVEIDRKTSPVAAKAFADANNLTAAGLPQGSGTVVIGAANFPESQTLAELYKITLAAAGFNASVLQSTNREIYEPALERGEITVFPEYAATLTEFLNKKGDPNAAPKASGDINVTMAALKGLAAKNNLAVGTPSAASDQNAFATTKATADKYGLKSLSDFAAKCSGTASVLAGPPECPQRPYCQVGLKDTYGITFGSFFQADTGGPQTKTALRNGSATLGLVFSSDSSLQPA